ncbi:MAG: hypothetical protein IIA08_04585 [Proteobacteria bacterium]|nr:hypothetical protein [Pseudomonadota bacterium]
MKTLIFRSSILLLLLGLAACGGTKVLKEPEPMVVAQPLATASDENLSVTLDWVIFRDGPGTWARNVDWDEYLIRVQNLGDDSIQLTNITVIDSLGVSAEVGVSRKKLVKASKKTKKRYKGQGLKVKAGLSGAALAGTGLVLAASSSGLGAAAMAGGGAAATAAGVVLLVPALAVGGIVRGVNNSKVNNRIESRQTLLPIVLQDAEEKTLDIFFPLSPSPRQVQLTYVDSGSEHTLIIDTQAALEGLHLASAAE